MNDFGQLQLIWIRRLASETGRITALIEAGNLSVVDLIRYKKSISAMDAYCRFVIESQDWDDINRISEIVDDVEEKLFVHFYEMIDHFEDEDVHFDFSNEGDGEIVLNFDDDSIRDLVFTVINDEDISMFL